MKSVNVKPNKANKLLSQMMLPFALKAGMIGRLNLKFNLLSFWSNPMDVEIDEVLIILGPNMNVISHDEVR